MEGRFGFGRGKEQVQAELEHAIENEKAYKEASVLDESTDDELPAEPLQTLEIYDNTEMTYV